MNTYIFTCGDVNGIGPEIVIKTLNKIRNTENRFIFIIPENAFEKTAAVVKPEFEYTVHKSFKHDSSSQVLIHPLKKSGLDTGIPTRQSGKTSFTAVKKSFELLSGKKADAVITAPISKLSLNLAGINFPGHTEMFAKWSGIKNYVMMFLSDEMKAALNTIHIPLKDVTTKISAKTLIARIHVVLSTLKVDLGIKHPRLAVLGLNPHAGEEGVIGKEELKIINPVINKIAEAEGPFSPDAFFAAKLYRNYDIVFGMYHDQVLIPFKMLNFSRGVNYTAGLPVIRTSPDHGTAFDVAGRGKADESSMVEAFRYAQIIVKNRKS